jgi:hypothetical protein
MRQRNDDHFIRVGSICLNSSFLFDKWNACRIMPRPGLIAAGYLIRRLPDKDVHGSVEVIAAFRWIDEFFGRILHLLTRRSQRVRAQRFLPNNYAMPFWVTLASCTYGPTMLIESSVKNSRLELNDPKIPSIP